MKKLIPILLSLAFAFPGTARAQTPADLAVQQVVALAPQLGLLAGSPANLAALASGLVLGQPIVLRATGTDGITQIVTIAASAPMTPVVAAQTLERTRQALIVRGIGSPTPEQVGVSLTGGTLPTPIGNTLVAGTLSGSINPAQLQVERQVAGLSPLGASAANVQALNTGLTAGTPITLTGTTAGGTPTSLTFSVPGGRLSTFEAAQALQFAGQLLASQGIVNPTPEQIRAALVGGTITSPAVGAVSLRGVLEGRGTVQTAISGVGTSFSPTVSTSASPILGTSDSPTFSPNGTAGSASTGSSGANGAPSPAVQMQGRR